MTHTNIIRSWPAIALGTTFAAGTTYVLTEDLWHGARFTTAHLMTVLAIVGTIAAAHGAWPRLLRGEVLAAGALGLIFLGGTFVIVTSSAGRNAEVQQSKNTAVRQRNVERADMDGQVAEARKVLRTTEDARAKECGSGKGPRCEGWKSTVEAHVSHVALIEARRQMMGGVERENAGYAHAAAVYGAMLGSEPASVERTLTLLMPFALVLICEFGTIVFLGLGIGHGVGPTGGQRVPQLPEVPEVVEDEPNVVQWAQAFEAKNKRSPRLPELQAAFPSMSRTTLWRRTAAA